MNNKLSSPRDQFTLLLRQHEIQIVSALLREGHKKILEIGGGNGWQAHLLHEQGHDITSIDISPQSDDSAYFPVLKYDGHRVPFKDASFDIVFSSNVLEHIPHLDIFESELQRILKPGGRAIHVLPTSTWRILTSITHPSRVIRALVQHLNNKNDHTNSRPPSAHQHKWLYAFWPNRHGEKGNSLSEIYWFSKTAWLKHFTKTGWHVENTRSTSLVYTGNLTLHSHLSINKRKRMARYFGSSTRIFLLKPINH